MVTALIFLAVLAILIFVHELGHFLAAKLFGIRVDEFSLGFGPKIFSWRFPSKHVIKTGETVYSLRVIPFGGYVKIFGENPDYESTQGVDSERSFVNKPRWKQAIVLSAGVLFNFIFAGILFSTIYMFGITASLEGFEQYADRFTDRRIIITQVTQNSPAQSAGFKIGDELVSIQNVVIEDVSYVQDQINQSGGNTLGVTVRRGEEVMSIPVSATTSIVEGKYAVGIAMAEVGDLKLPFFTSIYEGVRYTGILIYETVVGLFTFIGQIFRGSADFSVVTGPVGIAGFVGDAADFGFTSLLMVVAFISVNLGVINLMPFPALDGGRLVFVGIESVIRRRIAPKSANVVNAVGFALLMALMVFVTYRDIVNL